MENDEESEISSEFGRVLRMVMGAAMQAKEASERRSQDQFRQSEQLAAVLKKDMSSPSFTQLSGAQIADRMTVASELAGAHRTAAHAFMAGSDRLRNEMGINVEDLYKNHPQSAEERHAALRHAIDDYQASARLSQEAAAEHETAAQEPDGSEAEASAARLDDQAAEREESAETHLAASEQAEAEVQLDERGRDAAEARQAENTPTLGHPVAAPAAGATAHPEHVGPGAVTAAAALARARAMQGFPHRPSDAVRLGLANRPARRRATGQSQSRSQGAEVTR